MQSTTYLRILSIAVAIVLVSTNVEAGAPVEQSRCEVEATRYAMRHPREKKGIAGIQEDFRMLQEKGFMPFHSLDALPPSPVSPYRDPETGITFVVDADGRHVTAKNAAGELLWARNPFVDFNLCPYRSLHPYIVWIGPPEGGNGPGWHIDSPSTARPDAMTNAQIFSELSRIVNKHWPVRPPIKGDRFMGLAFNSSQMGYVNIRNGDFYMMGQN